MESKIGYVYIMASSFKKIYIGMTTDLQTRVKQHKEKTNPECHTADYTIDKLVYYEQYPLVVAAIRREKVLKGWLRIRKLELIIRTNPLWKDLSADWGKQAKPFDLSREKELMRPPETFPTGKPSALENAGVLRYAQDDGEGLKAKGKSQDEFQDQA